MTNYYNNSHLFVSAIRVLDHQKSTPPSIEEVCRMLSFSLELGNLVCNKLVEIGAVEIVRGAFGTRLFIKDHKILEELPREEHESRLETALKEFRSSQSGYSKKVASIKADQDKKRKNLFADLEKKLKGGLNKKP